MVSFGSAFWSAFTSASGTLASMVSVMSWGREARVLRSVTDVPRISSAVSAELNIHSIHNGLTIGQRLVEISGVVLGSDPGVAAVIFACGQ